MKEASYNFEVGDVVRLKSGGPLLTVLDRSAEDENRVYQVACIMPHGLVLLVAPEQALM